MSWSDKRHIICSGSGLIFMLILISYCHKESLFSNQSGTCVYEGRIIHALNLEVLNATLLSLSSLKFVMKLLSITRACHIGHKLGRKVAINCCSQTVTHQDSLYPLKISANMSLLGSK